MLIELIEIHGFLTPEDVHTFDMLRYGVDKAFLATEKRCVELKCSRERFHQGTNLLYLKAVKTHSNQW
jgi:hypothetical protein